MPTEVESTETESAFEYVPIFEFEWKDEYYQRPRYLTCKNHTTARYYTKNPFDRNIHIVRLPEGDIERNKTGECVCPLTDLVVIVKAKAPVEE